MPLPDDVADDLVPFLSTIPTGEPVFALPAKGAEMLKVDLAFAGIPYIDAAGLVFDFHALRCECATLADQAGSSIVKIAPFGELWAARMWPLWSEMMRCTMASPSPVPVLVLEK